MSITFPISSERVAVAGFRALIEALNRACTIEGVTCFLVGALARDLLMEQVHGIRSPRATRDVDVAVALESWNDYQSLISRLTTDYGFRKSEQSHRFISPQDTPLDIIPFGNIEDPVGQISWPPEHELVMSTLGYEEVQRYALRLIVDGDLEVAVASLAGIGVLKLLAWRDRRFETNKDAEDFCFLMRNYYDANEDAVYTEHADLFDDESFDHVLASARVFGRDAATIVAGSESLRSALMNLIGRESADNEYSNLAAAMGATYLPSFDKRLECLRAYSRGLRERTG